MWVSFFFRRDNACVCRLSFAFTVITAFLFPFNDRKKTDNNKNNNNTHNLWKQVNNPPGTNSLWNCMNFSNRNHKNSRQSVGWFVRLEHEMWYRGYKKKQQQRKKIFAREMKYVIFLSLANLNMFKATDACHLPECLAQNVLDHRFCTCRMKSANWTH